MSAAERRLHPRYNPPGLHATLKLGSDQNPVILEGEIVDVSYNGIKLKLMSPIGDDLGERIVIELCLPDSNIPFSIIGTLRHRNHLGELGLEYIDCPVVEALDSFMFECIKLAKS